jgi:hypothetical protein
LRHTDPRTTWPVTFSDSSSAILLTTTVDAAPAVEVLLKAVAYQLVQDGLLDSVQVNKTSMAGTTTVITY